MTETVRMSKPSHIPNDVWAAADAALDNMLCNCIEASGSEEQFRADSVTAIADAILAERKRCAAVAKKAALRLRGWPVEEYQADEIAKAIQE